LIIREHQNVKIKTMKSPAAKLSVSVTVVGILMMFNIAVKGQFFLGQLIPGFKSRDKLVE